MRVFADFEFNGQLFMEPIQFGIVLTDDECNLIETFESLVCPSAPITEHVERLTSITNEMVEDVYDFPIVFIRFLEFLEFYKDEPITFYAWGKDWKQIRKNCKVSDCLEEFDLNIKRVVDYQSEVSRKTLYKGQMLTKALGLNDVKKLYGIPNEVQHDALSDAMDTYNVYKAIEVDKKAYDEEELKRIYEEKKVHIAKMKDSNEKRVINYCNSLVSLFQNKKVKIDKTAFRKLKSSQSTIFKNIESCVNEPRVFSKNEVCKYQENVELIITLEINQNEVYLNYEVLLDKNKIGSFKDMITVETYKFIGRFLTSFL